MMINSNYKNFTQICLAAFFAVITILNVSTVTAQTANSVVNSVHNLSVSGPGNIHAVSEQQICIFCHASHNSSTIQPLWNRSMPVDVYTIYTSNSLDANVDQPTGSSKMCLSCHDGTIALGNVFSRDTDILMSGGITEMPAGNSNLTTDLSDDHPISFQYDSTLVLQDTDLVHPSMLPQELKLDVNQELQCTTCHDAHDNSNGSFLVMNDKNTMCKACHTKNYGNITGHNDCTGCHKTHSSPSGPYLMTKADVTRTCINCHAANGPGTDLSGDFAKLNVHDTSTTGGGGGGMYDTDCVNCHDPHSIKSGTATAPDIQPQMGHVSGISASGGNLAVANYQFEVCFKCHADNAVVDPFISRQIVQNNTRYEFEPTAASFHPVEAPGKNNDVPSLLPGWTTSSIIYCNDCHNSDNGTLGPDGVHGSNEEPLLRYRYETTDYTNESASTYELCYSCHDRDSILNDESFDEHRKHIREEDAPCSACHDAHGISSLQGNSTNNSHLINFDLNIVQADSGTGMLKFEDLGNRRGRCWLKCHGERHSPESY